MRFLILLTCTCAIGFSQTAVDRRFDVLMRDILILDTHVDTPRYVVDEDYKFAEEHRYYEADIPRLRKGHVGAIFFGVYVQPQDFPPPAWIPRTLECIDAFHQEAGRNAKDMEIARTAADIVRIHKSGKIAALVSIEGGHLIQDSLRILRDYYRLGIRYMTLAHFKTNNWADSGTDKPIHNGLSGFGKEVVGEMNRLGMMVDISHVSDKTFYDALEFSRAPVFASHSSLRALCDIPRNMTDEMIKALGRKGGVVCINFNVAYLDKKAYDIFIAFRDQRDRDINEMMARNKANPRRWELLREIQQRYKAQLPRVDVKAVLKQIDHAAKVAGADHVGLGSDFDGISGMAPAGMEDVSKYPVLVRGLIEMGYSDSDIRKIMGENMLRVMRANEAVAAKY